MVDFHIAYWKAVPIDLKIEVELGSHGPGRRSVVFIKLEGSH